MAFDQPEADKGRDHDADLGHQDHAAQDLQQRLAGAGGRGDAARLPRRDGDDEGGKEPEPQRVEYRLGLTANGGQIHLSRETDDIWTLVLRGWGAVPIFAGASRPLCAAACWRE